MKKLTVVVACVLMLSVGATSASAISYCKDFLEAGNAGGPGSPKTFDSEWSMRQSQTVDMDVWLNDSPERILTAGFYILFDPARVSVAGVQVYDGVNGPAGPWDPSLSAFFPIDASTYFVAVGNLACVNLDGGGDVILSRVRFRCEAPGDAVITLRPIPDFDTVVGCAQPPVVYDSVIPINTVTIHQTECLANSDCNDNNPCTSDSCNLATNLCVHTSVPGGTSCEDGLFCTVADQCVSGVCTSGSARDCSTAGNQCNAGTCDENLNQCVSQPVANGTACNDGLFCTQTDECQNGQCLGAGATCPEDANSCTDDCDEASDTCYLCNAAGSSDPCCEDPACASQEICLVSINEFYVDGTNGSNANDGLTPSTAWKTITHALNQVPVLVALGDNDRALVHVAPSLYDTVMGGGDAETFPLVMKKHLSLIADQGYAGTIIDAEQTGSVIEFTKEEASANTITIEGFTITGGSNFRGGGITVLWADPNIRRCLITGNVATDTNGGGIYLQRANPTITDCIISDNSAPRQKGGGISCGNISSPAISNCTIVNNSTGCGLDEGGGGLFAGAGSYPVITNSIFWDNYRDCSPDPQPDQLLALDAAQIPRTDLTVGYSCIQDGYSGTGNTAQDPAFFGTQYFLSYGSPCIDSGTSDGATTPSDIDGNPRYDHLATSNTGAGASPYYDMGAREYQNDTDGDGVLDDGDEGGTVGNNPCTGGATTGCDDNCIFIPNPAQEDTDGDGVGDVCDNCPLYPNGTILGTCVTQQSPNLIIVTPRSCVVDADCTLPNQFCDNEQRDGNGNGIGDVCQCESDFDCDTDVDGSDAVVFKRDFGRTPYTRPCTVANPCIGDYDGDGDVDGTDAAKFKEDFGRNEFNKPCASCYGE